MRLSNPHIILDLSENGESDLQRATAPLVGLCTRGRAGRKLNLPEDIFVKIISFLQPSIMPIIHSTVLHYMNNHKLYIAQHPTHIQTKKDLGDYLLCLDVESVMLVVKQFLYMLF